MVSRSIVGRFLILAVLLVSLGVIAQAALIISRGPKAVAKASTGPDRAMAAAQTAPTKSSSAQSSASQSSTSQPSLASLGTAGANAATPPMPVADAQGADAAPVRVVYPGPLGAAPVQPPHKITDAAPAVPAAAPMPAAAPVQTAVVVAPPATAPVDTAPAPVAAPPVVTAPAATRATPAVVVASADADAQPAPSGHGVNLNSASMEELNRLGGGHIGHSIIQHRPYHSVEDLVKKRVVRRSVFEQIKNQVAAD
ncbi:helix-hairpin-helix domain-containing protein [Lichenibacterium ramalinae]|uniref:Helix-hairpin-helix domain-containing protein n=1 Tax=Lichenibacterium ramalinae TaxID=2316527 RepID=A0A4Q2RHS7_9HYPH|nr:helix-hairpin-helix domain-containing protein [Lichenibacterium ramalinae]RYB07242.1 helix-hairpin-helix domain-containing protein [Lichenibacterium ramalinae]